MERSRGWDGLLAAERSRVRGGLAAERSRVRERLEEAWAVAVLPKLNAGIEGCVPLDIDPANDPGERFSPFTGGIEGL